MLISITKIFERPKSDVAFAGAHKKRGFLNGFAPDWLVACGDGKGAGGWDSQMIESLAGEEFSDRRAKNRPAIAHP